MDKPERLELREGYARHCLDPNASFDDRVAAVTHMIEYCRKAKIRRLLVNGLKHGELDVIPTVLDRYWAAQELGEASEWQVNVVFVLPPEYIDPERCGLMFMENARCRANVFATEQGALEWLMGL